jgi:integrase
VSVRKRTWKNAKGETKEAWIVDYTDQQGERHIETFVRKKEADERHAVVKVDVAKGVHSPLSGSATVANAAEDWLTYVELEGCERATLANYRDIVNLHLVPRIGPERLAKLTTPRINAFRDELVRDLSRIRAKKVLGCLKAIIRDAKRRGNVAQNVASDVMIATNKRAKRRLEVGIDIPTPAEISKILAAAAAGRRRAFLVTAVFTGLRSSELRVAVERHRLRQGRAARAPARRPLQHHRPSQVAGKHPHDSDRSIRGQHAAGMAAGESA